LFKNPMRLIGFAMLLGALATGNSDAAEFNIAAGGAMRAVLQELVPLFEKSSGHRLTVEYGTVAKVAEKVTNGEPIDVAILTKPPLDKLVNSGRITGDEVTRLAHVPIGVAVRKGSPQPDIASVEAVKRTLLASRLVTYGDPGMGDAAGVHMAKVMEDLGIAVETKPKTRLISPPAGQSGAQFLAAMFGRGEAEIAMAPISVLSETRGTDVVGLLPTELQSRDLTFFAAQLRTSRQPTIAKSFIEFLAGPSAATLYQAKGLEPG
jgi:molybdate transport system substrate-binding protein